MLKKAKYRNKKVEIDGITFDSLKEGHRYNQLKLLQRGGVISDLQLQVRFDFELNGVKMGFYKADFGYIEEGKRVIEDVKGMKTPVYNLKKKMMLAFHDIKIRET